MMIDELGIFKEVREVCDRTHPEVKIYAFGSRARGSSRTKKWDFDITIGTDNMEILKEISGILKSHFEGRKDEFGNSVKIDIFRTRVNSIDEFKQRISYAVLL